MNSDAGGYVMGTRPEIFRERHDAVPGTAKGGRASARAWRTEDVACTAA
jgi:hypothetical protein